MHHPVPLYLQQPLFIDTDINYSLDMSKFPGLDDPQHMYEPALLIAQQLEHSVDHFGIPSAGTSSPDQPFEPTKDMLEDLLNIIDPSTELLDRLSAPKDQLPGEGMYKSIVDACGFAPNPPTITRKIGLSSQFYNQPQCMQRTTNSVLSDRHSMVDYYNGLTRRQQTATSLYQTQHARTQSTGYPLWNTASRPTPGSTSALCNKRKRSEDTDVSLCKRPCSRTNVHHSVGQSGGYVHPYHGFKETFGANRSFGLSY